jgi:hypothetical protein
MVKRGPHLAIAVGLGYLLGRRRKLRTALALGAAAAIGRLSRDPGQLLARGTKALGGSAEMRRVAELGGPLVEAGKAAARAAVSNRIGAMSERVQDRGEALRRPRRGTPDEETGVQEPEEGPAAEEYEPYEEVQRRPRRRAPEEPTEPEEPEYDEQEEAPPPRAPRARRGEVPVRRRGR